MEWQWMILLILGGMVFLMTTGMPIVVTLYTVVIIGAYALLGGTIGAALLLWLVSLAGLGLRGLFGLRVGGYLMVWFCLAGIVGLLLLRTRLSLPSRRAVLGGLLAFVALWLGVGLFGQFVWLHWLLIPRRLRKKQSP